MIFLIIYFSFNLGAVMADLIVHHKAEDKPYAGDVVIELLLAFPIMVFYFIATLFD